VIDLSAGPSTIPEEQKQLSFANEPMSVCKGWMLKDGIIQSCDKRFVPKEPRQKYHSEECRLWTSTQRRAGHQVGDCFRPHRHRRTALESYAPCRNDPAWEARNHIVDHVICRICFVPVTTMSSKTKGHLHTHHGISTADYRAKYPAAPLKPIAYLAKGSHKGIEEFISETVAKFLTPDQLADCRLNPAWEVQQVPPISDRIVCRVCGMLITSLAQHLGLDDPSHKMTNTGKPCHPKMALDDYDSMYPLAPHMPHKWSALRREKDIEEHAEGRADRFVSADELRECRGNPAWEEDQRIRDYVVCRKCGMKIHDCISGTGQSHLTSGHGMTWEEYRDEFPGAPRSPIAWREEQRMKATKKRAQLSAAWRPDDWWDDDKTNWRIIGNELLSRNTRMDNEELAERLNKARVLKCPFGEDWDCITRAGTAMNFITKIRTWVKRPLKVRQPK
jgi:predicted transcriptional regulator